MLRKNTPRLGRVLAVIALGITPFAASVGECVAGPPEPPPCSGPPYELARRLTGTWEELSLAADREVLEGTLRTELRAGGCALVQEFTSLDGSFRFSSLGYVEPGASWHETFVFSTGGMARYRWSTLGDDILVSCLNCRREKRLRITGLGHDEYLVIEEHSQDAGRSWTEVERTRTRRVPERAP